MKPCTDKDIAGMEMDAEDQIVMNGTYEIDGEDWKFLLARLEAAEKYIEKQRDDADCLGEYYEKWKKAAGK